MPVSVMIRCHHRAAGSLLQVTILALPVDAVVITDDLGSQTALCEVAARHESVKDSPSTWHHQRRWIDLGSQTALCEVAARLESDIKEHVRSSASGHRSGSRSYRGATLGRRQIYFDPPEVKKSAPGALGAGILITLVLSIIVLKL